MWIQNSLSSSLFVNFYKLLVLCSSRPNSLVWKKTNGELCWESRVLCFGGMICICLWWVLLSGGDTVDGGRWTVDLVVMAEDENNWSRESLMRLCESDYQHVSNNWIYIYFYNASLNR